MICVKKVFFTYYHSTKKFYGDDIGHETGAILHEQDVRRIYRSGNSFVVIKRPVDGDENIIEFIGWHKVQQFIGRHPHDFAYSAYLGGRNLGFNDPEIGDFHAAMSAKSLEKACLYLWQSYMENDQYQEMIEDEARAAYERTNHDNDINLIKRDNLLLRTAGIYD